MARSLETLPVANVALPPLGDDIADYRMLAALPLRGRTSLLGEAEREEIVKTVMYR